MTRSDATTGPSNGDGQAAVTASGLKAWVSPRRWRFWIILLFILYTLGGFLFLPWLVERLAVGQVNELGRTLTIAEVKVNPFVLSIELTDTELHDSDGELLFSYDTYFWNFQASSLFRWAWTFAEIRLDGLWLNLERFRPGEHRIGRLVDAFPDETPAEGPEKQERGGLPRLIIQDFQLNNGHLLLTDNVDGQEFKAEYGPINVKVQNLTTLPNRPGEQSVSIATTHGGSISWSGNVHVHPFSSEGHFSIRGKSMEAVHRYLGLHLPFRTDGEATEFEFDYRVERDTAGELEAEISNLSADVHELHLSLPDSEGRLLELPRVSVSGASLRWPQQDVEVGSLIFDQPRLSLERSADGALDVMQIFTRDEAVEAERQEQEDEPGTGGLAGWTVSLGRLGIEQGSVQLQDQAFDPPAKVGASSIALVVEQISNQPESVFPSQLGLELDSGGRLDFKGELTALPELSAGGKLAASGLRLKVIQPWLSQRAHVSIEGGELSLNGEVRHGPAEPGAFNGSVQIEGFALNDTLRGEQLAGWAALEIDQARLSLAEARVETSEVELREPYGRLAIAPDKTTNFSGLFAGEAEESGIPGASGEIQSDSTRSLNFLVGGLDIEDARLDFSDLSLPLPFAVAIRSLGGTVSTLSNSSSEPARIGLEGQVNEYGSAEISGTTNAWDFTDNTDIQMKFRNLEMAELTPYSIQFAGHEIESGRLDLDLDYEVKKGKMLGDNKIIARQLTIGDKVEHPDAVSLPLKLAVALLKDGNGVIDVDLPVSGDLNDPEFRIGGIVMKAIFNLLTRIVTSPFRLLGNLVGVDSEDFGTLSFEAGESGISPPDREKLAKLADAMVQRPELELTVSGVYAEAADSEALKVRKVDDALDARIAQLEADGGEPGPGLRRQAIESLFLETMPEVALESVQAQHMVSASEEEGAPQALDELAYLADLRRQLIEHETVTQAELEALAQARADAIVAELVSASSEQPLEPRKAGVKAIEGKPGDNVPLELSVSVGDLDQGQPQGK